MLENTRSATRTHDGGILNAINNKQQRQCSRSELPPSYALLPRHHPPPPRHHPLPLPPPSLADLRGPGPLPLNLPVPVARGSLQKGQGAMLVCSLLASLRRGRAHLLCVSPSRRSRASLPSLGILAPGFGANLPFVSSLRKGRANLGCIFLAQGPCKSGLRP